MTRRIAGFVSKDTPPEPDFSLATTSIEDLRLKTLEILRREVLNLMGESTRGKLSPTSSKSLTDYIKLLSDLKDLEAEELEKLSEEHLRKIAAKE